MLSFIKRVKESDIEDFELRLGKGKGNTLKCCLTVKFGKPILKEDDYLDLIDTVEDFAKGEKDKRILASKECKMCDGRVALSIVYLPQDS